MDDRSAAVAPPGVDTRDMVEVHRVFRREFGLAGGLVQAVRPGDGARADGVATHLELMSSLLQRHHEGEDDLLWPLLRSRVAEEVDQQVPLMEAQHLAIHELSAAAAALMQCWRGTAAVSDRDELASLLDRLHGALVEHLDIEEERILPLAARHLSEHEWQLLGEEGFSGMSKKQLPLAFGMLMYRGDPEVIAHMLSHAPRIARLLMPIVAPRAHARYAKRIHGTATP